MSMSTKYIDLDKIPTLKQSYEEGLFSQRNLKRAAQRKEMQFILVEPGDISIYHIYIFVSNFSLYILKFY